MADNNNSNESPENPSSGFSFRYGFLGIFTILILFALFSHDPDDFSVISGGSNGLVGNWIGNVGAYTACTLLYFFGLAIFPLMFLYIICSFRPLIHIPIKRKKYFTALFVLSLGVIMLFAISPQTFVEKTAELGIGHIDKPHSALSGGVVGQFLASPPAIEPQINAGIIRRLLSTVGTLIIAIGLFLCGAIIIWLADWQAVLTHLMAEARKRGEARAEKTPDASIKVPVAVKPEPRPRPTPLVAKPIVNQFGPEPVPEPECQIKAPAKSTAQIAGEELSKIALEQGTTTRLQKNVSEYVIPPMTMLSKGAEPTQASAESIEMASKVLQHTLESFNVDGQVTNIISGPRVTRFEISLAPGVKVEKVANIANNIAMELEAKSIRILAPIPGRNAVGVEAPNAKASSVFLRNVMESPEWKNSSAEIPIVLGQNVAGSPIILDLAKAPHLLIAGATGSGKSVCMNALIMSLLFHFKPEELKLIMVDPKVVEFETYTSLPQLITPVVNDPQKVPLALRWAVNEMEKRYKMLAKVRTRNLKTFNSRPIPSEPVIGDDGKPIPDKLPILIVIIDELADVMMTDAKADVETSVARIAQKGRAAGIHVVIATQRPSTNIITGIIKANLPTRIAFRVGSIVDSRVILDQKGAETLLGSGDMLFIPPGGGVLERIQGAFVEDRDIDKVVELVSAQCEQQFNDTVVADEGSDTAGDLSGSQDDDNSIFSAPEIAPVVKKYLEPDDTDLIRQALEITLLERKVSTSYLQRRLKIGYNRAAEIVEIFEERGIVSPPLPGGSKREILVFDEIDGV
ncbi:MAG: DNA translocase FtsK 4TM domain-containing protein [Victivallaceae bacterium]|nr:DNA translocase FtsK 4TM domain-containing protein [Victivallaceae bacterium]